MVRPPRKVLYEETLRLIGVPAKFFHTTLRDFETSGNESLEQVVAFIGEFLKLLETERLADMKGIFFYGSNGVGKTMLSSIILREAYRLRYSARRVTFTEYINVYTRVWNAKSADEREMFESKLYSKYKAVEVLVLEEVGKEVDSKIASPILEDLLRFREDRGYVTIICMNATPDNMRERYGDSVYSLVRGGTVSVKITGRDKREL